MTVTLKTIRQMVNRRVTTRRFNGTANASGGSTTTLVDDELKAFPGNDYFLNHYILFTSGSDAGDISRISAFTASSGTVTFTPAISAAPNSATYEIMAYHPTLLVEKVNEALRAEFLKVSRHIVDDSHVSSSPIMNPGFEVEDPANAGKVYGWEGDVSVTIPRTFDASGTYLWGQHYTRGAGSDTAIRPIGAFKRIALVLQDYTIQLHAWVYNPDATEAVGIYDGSNNNNGTVSAAARWVRRTSAAVEISDVDVLYPRIMTGSAGQFVANTWFEGGPTLPYLYLPYPWGQYQVEQVFEMVGQDRDKTQLTGSLRRVTNWRVDTSYAGGGQDPLTIVHFDQPPAAGTRLRLHLSVLVSSLTADTDEADITDPQAEFLATAAAIRLLEAEFIPASSRDYVQAQLTRLRGEYIRLLPYAVGPTATLSPDL